jgi:hypothetical protein
MATVRSANQVWRGYGLSIAGTVVMLSLIASLRRT